MSQHAKAPETRAPETKVPETNVPEPSIDEILASIRRSIVPDGDAERPAAVRKPGSRKPGPAPASSLAGAKGRRADGAAARAGSDQRTDTVAERVTDRATERGHEGGNADDGPSAADDEGRAAKVDPGRGDENNAPGHPVDGVPPLLSPRTTAALDTAFNSLTHTVLSQNPRTLEDLVREMLKPMLKAWLDANLPDIVERMVRAEIERVSRRG